MTPFGPDDIDPTYYDPTEVGDVVTLDWLKVGAVQRLPRHLHDTVAASVHRDHLRDELVYTLSVQVLGKRVPTAPVIVSKRFHFEIPASPWQAFKQRHARSWWAGWLARWWPVVMHVETRIGELTVEANRAWVWPNAPVTPDSFGRPVKLVNPWQRSRWWTPEKDLTPNGER